jgi:hypothetical protein
MITNHHIAAQLAAERQRELRAAGPARRRWTPRFAAALGGAARADQPRPPARRGMADQSAAVHPAALRARRAPAAERRERVAG